MDVYPLFLKLFKYCSRVLKCPNNPMSKEPQNRLTLLQLSKDTFYQLDGINKAQLK
jgi:hypothetical protein